MVGRLLVMDKGGYYPTWIDRPPPTELCCTHAILEPQRGQVCSSFYNCTSRATKPKAGGKGGGAKGGGAKAKGMGKTSGKLGGQAKAAKGGGKGAGR